MKTRRFTLIELLSVIVIISILAGLVIGASSFASRHAAVAKTISALEKMKLALEEHRQDRGYYPIRTTGPAELATIFGTGATPPNWRHSSTNRPYLEGWDGSRYTDAWGNSFYYECGANGGTMNPESYDLWSMGPDRTQGDADVIGNTNSFADAQTVNASESDDITNWKRN